MSEERFVILVTGDRNWSLAVGAQMYTVRDMLRKYRRRKPIVVHGAARGVDTIADNVAKAFGYDVHPHPAEWDKYHKAAGPIRNKEMLEEEPDVVLAFHDDLTKSKGTRNMVNQALDAGVPVFSINSKGERVRITAQIVAGRS